LKKFLALGIAAVLSLAVAAPAFAQPFADVDALHWAFDAIVELAAKGIIEGYPDGTFKGDRAMTRYEMAMVASRLLARIEAIKIPPPPKIPPPEVTRADIDRLTRLLNEFRAELSALGVRITALEEELAALRARVDNTFITGNWTYVYVTGGGFTTGTPEVQRNRIRLNIRGRLSPEFQVFLRARWNSLYTFSGFSGCTTGHCAVTDFDRLRGDWASPWFGMVWSVGREYWQLGPLGHLLFAETSREGMRVTGGFGGINWTVLGFWNSGGAGSKTYGVRVELPSFAGWTFGVNYRQDRNNLDTSDPLGNGTGFGFDWSGSFMGGFTFSGEYASWNPVGGCPDTVDPGDGCTTLFAKLSINLGQFVGASQFAPMLSIYYRDFRQGFVLTAGTCGATTCSDHAFLHQGNWLFYTLLFGGQFWGVDLSLQLSSRLSGLIAYETGTVYGIADTTTNGLLARAVYTLSRNATAEVEYGRQATTTSGTTTTISGAAFRVFFSW
jgi:hypothetical protein